MMCFGKVVYFNDRDEKKFGFIQVESMEQKIFFHLSRLRDFYCDGSPNVQMVEPKEQAEPKHGRDVVFILEQGPQGPRAKFWGYVESYNQARMDILARPMFRLMHRDGRIKLSRLWEAPKIRTFWQGNNVQELRKQCPQNLVKVHDSDWSGNHFEIFNKETNEWEPCEDPR